MAIRRDEESSNANTNQNQNLEEPEAATTQKIRQENENISRNKQGNH